MVWERVSVITREEGRGEGREAYEKRDYVSLFCSWWWKGSSLMFPHTFLCFNGELGVRGKAVVSHLSISWFFWVSMLFCSRFLCPFLSFLTLCLFWSWHLHFPEEWKNISLILNSIYLHKLVRVYDLKDSAVFKIGLFLSLKIISTQCGRV